MFTKKAILTKTIQMGIYTLLSRGCGIIREIFMVKYLGASALSDAFLTAFKIPNSLRKFFAEGALSAALVPALVTRMHKGGKKDVAGLMAVTLLVFESIVLALMAIIIVYAQPIIGAIAPGFSDEQIAHAVPFVRILMPFIAFISTSALLAAPLQAVGNFFVVAISPVILNGLFIAGLLTCLWGKLSPDILCWFIVVGSFLQLLLHAIVFARLHFSFGRITKSDLAAFGKLFLNFLLCLPSISMMELSLFIDTSFASYLPSGQLSLLYYANRFANISIGVFAVSFSTILLPHFSRIRTYAPRRLHFYLYESLKFVLWVMIPAAILLAFFSYEIFYTLFLSQKFTLDHVMEAHYILWAFSVGLIFFACNKIILNVYYALGIAWIPAIVSMGATIVNAVCNWFLLFRFQARGLAAATSFSAALQCAVLFFIAHRFYGFRLFLAPLAFFICRYTIQLICFCTLWFVLYNGCVYGIQHFLPAIIAYLLLDTFGFWCWVGPFVGVLFGALWYWRALFGIRLYFLEIL
jgi:putative peptidoglycan lipid II flippase